MPTKLTPIKVDENTFIYVEATEEVDTTSSLILPNPSSSSEEDEEEAVTRGPKEVLQKHFQDVQSTIYTYTSYTMAAFKKVAIADIQEVTLEFGIEIGGETGIPYVTKGTAKSNLKIQVKCKFSDPA